jgi:DNA polymerase-4
VIKIRYSNFDIRNKAMPDPIHFCRSYFDKKRDGIIRQAIPTSHAVASIGIRFSGLVRGTYQINMFEDRRNAIALSGDGSNEKRYGFDVARCAGATLKVKKK